MSHPELFASDKERLALRAILDEKLQAEISAQQQRDAATARSNEASRFRRPPAAQIAQFVGELALPTPILTAGNREALGQYENHHIEHLPETLQQAS